MKKVAFLVKGLTFFKSMGPLIYFSNKAGIIPVVIGVKERPGKEYDSIGTTEKLCIAFPYHDVVPNFEYQAFMVSSEKEIEPLLTRLDIKNVCCQDAFHHYPQLVNKFRVFSIGAFFDTAHLATMPDKLKNKPYKVYFPNEDLKKYFLEKSGIEVKNAVLGSPWFDHSIFTEHIKRDNPAVLFLTPPVNVLSEKMMQDIQRFVQYCEGNNILLWVKERLKEPWQGILKGNYKLVSLEAGLPYTAMQLACNTDVHITSYGTSIFESSYLGRPTINLEIDSNKNISSVGNGKVKNFGMNHLFNNDLCKTIEGDLIAAYESFGITEPLPFRAQETLEDNNSLRILRDIFDECAE